MNDSLVTFSMDLLPVLKEDARRAPKRRAFHNLHKNLTDAIQEMIVVQHQESYVRPHRHPGKLESFHLIEGLCTAVMFDDAGNIVQFLPLGGLGSGRALISRQHAPLWHSLVIETEFVVIHEVVNGPFDPKTTEWASWAPAADDLFGVDAMIAKMKHAVRHQTIRG